MRTFKDIYNGNTEAAIKFVTGYDERHCAYRYAHIHGAVERKGGWANFKHYVNNAAESDYLVFKQHETKIQEQQKRIDQLKQDKKLLIARYKAGKESAQQLKEKLKIAVEGLEKIKNSVTGGISTDKVNLIGLTNWVANVSIDSLEKIKNQE